MSYPIEDIEGIGPKYGAKLADAGITTTDHLLKLCCHKKGRKQMTDGCGISEKLILTWVNLADLMRISGVGPQFSELLEASGVDTVKELATRNAANLAVAMKKANEEKKLAKSTPNEEMITKWIAAAKTMEPLVTH